MLPIICVILFLSGFIAMIAAFTADDAGVVKFIAIVFAIISLLLSFDMMVNELSRLETENQQLRSFTVPLEQQRCIWLSPTLRACELP